MASIIAYIVIGYDFLVNASTLGLGMGAFWFAVSVTKEIRRRLHLVSCKTQVNEIQGNELKILLAESIYTHNVVKQLSIFRLTKKSEKKNGILLL